MYSLSRRERLFLSKLAEDGHHVGVKEVSCLLAQKLGHSGIPSRDM